MYNGPSIKVFIHLFEWQYFHEWRTCQLNHWLACFIHLRFVCMNHGYLLNFFTTNNIRHNGSSRLLGNTGELGFHTRGWPPPACSRSGLIVLNLFWFHDFERIKKPFRRYDFQLLCHYSMLMSPRTEVVVLLEKNTALFIFSIGACFENLVASRKNHERSRIISFKNLIKRLLSSGRTYFGYVWAIIRNCEICNSSFRRLKTLPIFLLWRPASASKPSTHAPAPHVQHVRLMERSCLVARMICEDKSGTVTPQVFLDVRYWSGLLLEQLVKMVSLSFQIKDYCLSFFACPGNVIALFFPQIVFCASSIFIFVIASIHWPLPFFIAILFVRLCPIIVFPFHPETELASIRS